MSEPHAKLKPLLDKFGVSYAAFLKKGRPTTSKAREFAKTKNWCFEIWTEKDKLHGHV